MYEFVAAALLPLAALLPAQDEAKPQKPASKPAIKRLSARHILIPWKGSAGATGATTVTKAEAKKKATEVAKLLSEGGDFKKLALEHSSCNSKADGGYLGQFDPKVITVKGIVEALQKVKDGEFTEPVESQLGWHVMQRLAIKHVWPKFIAPAHILIAYKGTRFAGPNTTRSKEEAKALAAKVYAEIKTGKKSYEDAAKAYSDDMRSKGKGGKIGEMPPEAFIASLVDAMLAIKVGAITAPLETSLGFHILRRDQVIGEMRASHILIPWKGAQNAPPGTALTKEKALEKAKELLAKIKKGGEDFAKLAGEHSSCPSKSRGGDLGMFRAGRMVAPFEKAVIASKVGDLSGPVETVFGYHIILRTK